LTRPRIPRSKTRDVDGYAFDDADGTMALLVGDYSDSDQAENIGATEIKRSFAMLSAFVQEALSGALTDGSVDETEPGYGLARDLRTMRPKIDRLRLYLVTDKMLVMRGKDLAAEPIDAIPTELHVWDIGRFHLAHESATGRDELEVDFSAEFGGGLRCLDAGGAQGEYVAYLCVIPGVILADVYERFGSRLLEGNVRSFLSMRGNVNKAIRATVLSRPEMFFAFNNGISATAESIRMSASGEVIESVRNLQIVNGGQTTATLAHVKRRGEATLDRIYVQMKLSVLPAKRAAVLIPEIARSSNSQNKITEADFFSNHPFHIRIEEFSRRLWAPAVGGAQHQSHWFYERARGQYLNEQARMSKAEKKQFLINNPREQVLTKTDVAKLENSWRRLPQKVSLGAQKNFMIFADWISKKWEEDQSQFHEEYFRRIVALAILFRTTEKLVSAQSWYQSGYRAQIVTYTLAKLSFMISNQALGRTLDLRRIWDRQEVPKSLVTSLAVIAASVFKDLTAEDRPKDNVTEWAKMEYCWDRIRDHQLRLPESVAEVLTDLGSKTSRERDAKKQQIEDDGIKVQVRVLEVGGDRWRKARDWAREKNLLTPSEATLLAKAADVPRKIPNERDSASIWAIGQRLISEGCPELKLN
jgi:hypothetical protein